ncbi:MAG TPA: hypothetical protein VIO94_08620 [Phenylobacterium sp.]
MPRAVSPRTRPVVWLSLVVLIGLSLALGLMAVRTSDASVAQAGPLIEIPKSPAPAPLPDAIPKRPS